MTERPEHEEIGTKLAHMARDLLTQTSVQDTLDRIADLREPESRWPHCAPRVRELGFGSMMGFLLFTEENNLGALDSTCPGPTRSPNAP